MSIRKTYWTDGKLVTEWECEGCRGLGKPRRRYNLCDACWPKRKAVAKIYGAEQLCQMRRLLGNEALADEREFLELLAKSRE